MSGWIVAFEPAVPGVFVTVGGGVRWEPLDPRNPTNPPRTSDHRTSRRGYAHPPSVPLPLTVHATAILRPLTDTLLGLQRLSCELNHNCGKDTWSGRWPGETDCERLGWMIGPGLTRPQPPHHRGHLEPRRPTVGRPLLIATNHKPGNVLAPTKPHPPATPTGRWSAFALKTEQHRANCDQVPLGLAGRGDERPCSGRTLTWCPRRGSILQCGTTGGTFARWNQGHPLTSLGVAEQSPHARRASATSASLTMKRANHLPHHDGRDRTRRRPPSKGESLPLRRG